MVGRSAALELKGHESIMKTIAAREDMDMIPASSNVPVDLSNDLRSLYLIVIGFGRNG